MLLAALFCLPTLLVQEAPSDRDLERLWKGLDESQRAEAIEWFRFEVAELDTLQLRLVRGLLGGHERDPAGWPRPAPTPHFDVAEHTGKAKKARRVLERSSSKARSAIKKFVEEEETDADGRWAYDWARGQVVVHGAPGSDEAVFRDALAGRPPGLDQARALCLAALDRGEERRAMQAFAHAYADRRGNVLSGVTLWDVWASGKRFEVPDADALGIVHTVLDDWSSWRPPLSTNEQRAIYGVIEGLFENARRYRELREALAEVLLLGEAALPAGYDALQVELHTLWVWSEQDATRLARELPGADRWKAFLAELPARCTADAEARQRGRERWGQLLADGRRVRALLVRVLEGMGKG